MSLGDTHYTVKEMALIELACTVHVYAAKDVQYRKVPVPFPFYDARAIVKRLWNDR